MVKVEVTLVQPDYGFEAKDAGNITARFDNAISGGGKGFGVSPMQSLLMALGSCSGIDVVSILHKKRQQIDSYKMIIEGQREQNKEPALWEKIHVIFQLSGNIEEEKALHAITLSIDKYCSVAETLRRAGCVISWELQLN